MSDIAAESQKYEKSCSFIDEIVELRGFKAERSSLVRTNNYYMELVSQLELKVSELKAQLMAKDYEIQLLSKKITLLTDEKNQAIANNEKNSTKKNVQEVNKRLTNNHYSIDINNEECKKLKIQLQNEKIFNEIFENQLKELGNNILLSEDSRKQCLNDQKIKKMQEEIAILYEDNQMLRSKLSCENIDVSTANKSLNSSELKSSLIELDSSESISPANSSPRLESSIPSLGTNNQFTPSFPIEEPFETPIKYINPEPPQTRCNTEFPKKALNRAVKYAKCALNEVVNSPTKIRQLADFCPSSMRKVRGQPLVN